MDYSYLKKILQSTNCPNIILYGPEEEVIQDRICKTLSTIYDIIDDITCSYKDIVYSRNNIYYKFNMKYIKNKNIVSFLYIIDDIINNKNFYTSLNNKIIILDHFSEIRYTLQNILRVKIEKYRITTLFILLTTNLTSIIEPLRSRCLCIRNPSISYSYKNTLFHKKLEVIHNITTIKEFFNYETHLTDFLFPYDILINRIMEIYKENYNNGLFTKLKEITYNILKNNLSVNKFYHLFLIKLLQLGRITDKKKEKIIYFFAKSQYNFIKSYRSLIVLESLLIHIYSILCDSILNDAILIT